MCVGLSSEFSALKRKCLRQEVPVALLSLHSWSSNTMGTLSGEGTQWTFLWPLHPTENKAEDSAQRVHVSVVETSRKVEAIPGVRKWSSLQAFLFQSISEWSKDLLSINRWRNFDWFHYQDNHGVKRWGTSGASWKMVPHEPRLTLCY